MLLSLRSGEIMGLNYSGSLRKVAILSVEKWAECGGFGNNRENDKAT